MYLWHWPVIIFAGFYAPEGIGVAFGVGLVAVTLALSALTKRFVEDPVRYRRLGNWKAIGFGALSVASCVLATSWARVTPRSPSTSRCLRPKS
jgi:peptidoglycan/LPS O-acetylase OafA/YrhL